MLAPFCESVSSSPWNFFGISKQTRLVPSVTRILSVFIQCNPLLGRRSVFEMRPAAIMMSPPSIFCSPEVVRTVTLNSSPDRPCTLRVSAATRI
jgi:hypothetical protein